MVATTPTPLFPEPAPTVNGRNYSLSIYVQQPTVIARDFAQLYSAYAFTGRLLPDSGALVGGAAKYYPNDPDVNAGLEEVEEVAPGAELPEYGGKVGAPKIAEVSTWGHKLVIPRQSLKRNDVRLYNRLVRGATASLDRKFRKLALAVISARLQEDNRFITAAADWSTFTVETATPTAPKLRPEGALDAAMAVFESDDQGQKPNLLVMNPADWLLFVQGYGRKRAMDVLSAYDLEPISNSAQPAHKALLAVEGQLGGTYWEDPLSIDTWDNKSIRSQQIDLEGSPAYVVDNTPGALEIRGISS
jgi:hypothetical protein